MDCHGNYFQKYLHNIPFVISKNNLNMEFWVNYLVVNSIDYQGSIVDGPGIRTVLFTQGCDHGCVGCHNQVTWNINKGYKIYIDDLLAELRNKVINKKLTISGGEPLMQYSSILKLVKSLQDFNIVLYTGFEYEDIPKDLFRYLDYIKVGQYMIEKHSTTIPYVGSSNQRFIQLGRSV